MTKCHCTHGVPWFRKCLDCEAEEWEKDVLWLSRDEFIWLRWPAETTHKIDHMKAEIWRP